MNNTPATIATPPQVATLKAPPMTRAFANRILDMRREDVFVTDRDVTNALCVTGDFFPGLTRRSAK